MQCVYIYIDYAVCGKVGHSMIIYLHNYQGVTWKDDDIAAHIISFTIEICHEVTVQSPCAAQRTSKLGFSGNIIS